MVQFQKQQISSQRIGWMELGGGCESVLSMLLLGMGCLHPRGEHLAVLLLAYVVLVL